MHELATFDFFSTHNCQFNCQQSWNGTLTKPEHRILEGKLQFYTNVCLVFGRKQSEVLNN